MKLFSLWAWLRPAYLRETYVAAAVVGSAMVGGVMSADAAGDAADAQQAAADQADATQRYQYDTTREDNKPFRETGVAANNQLAYLMGLSTNGAGAGSSFSEKTEAQIRQELLPEFRTGGRVVPTYRQELGTNDGLDVNGYEFQEDVLDENALSQAVQQRLAQQAQEKAKYEAELAARKSDPQYGSLLRNFTMADRDADPVYQSGLQFGLNEGVKGINRLASATGSYQSGATLKALTRFGNDYGSTKANESYNRFENNKNSTYNKLAGLSGAGQQATNQVSAAGTNMANNISQNQIGMGNARAASAIGQSNALTGALSQGVNWWQQNQLMNQPGGYNTEMARLNAQAANGGY